MFDVSIMLFTGLSISRQHMSALGRLLPVEILKCWVLSLCIYRHTAPAYIQPGISMSIEITKQDTTAAIASIQGYFSENMDEKIGNLEAGALLGFFLKEIAPVVYNKAVADAQTRMQARVMEIDIEIHEDEFQYWNQKKRK